MKVLIVDDEEMIRSLAERILKRAGFEVISVESGEEACKKLNGNPTDFDLLLLDLTMAGLSGEDTLSQIREKHPELPCIISSGQVTTIEDLPESIQSHVQFLHKPYRANELTEMVNSLLTGANHPN